MSILSSKKHVSSINKKKPTDERGKKESRKRKPNNVPPKGRPGSNEEGRSKMNCLPPDSHL